MGSLITSRSMVSCAIALLLSLSGVHSYAQRKGPLLGGTGKPSAERCHEIDVELGNLVIEITDLEEQVARAPVARRPALADKLREKNAREETLNRERIACTGDEPLSGSVTTSPGPAPSVLEGLPGAPVPPSPATRTGVGAVASGGGRSDLTKEQRQSICAQQFATYTRLRGEAPTVRANIERLESEVRLPTTTSPQRAQATRDLQALRERQTYVASQISIAEESMASIPGCNPTTGEWSEVPPRATPVLVVPPALAGTERRSDIRPADRNTPAASTTPIARAPANGPSTFDFGGQWEIARSFGLLTLARQTIPAGVTCRDAASAANPEYFAGRLEFRDWDVWRVAVPWVEYVRWPGVPIAPGREIDARPMPGIVAGCVVNTTTDGRPVLELSWRPQGADTPAGVLRFRGSSTDGTLGHGSVQFGVAGHDGAWMWTLRRK